MAATTGRVRRDFDAGCATTVTSVRTLGMSTALRSSPTALSPWLDRLGMTEKGPRVIMQERWLFGAPSPTPSSYAAYAASSAEQLGQLLSMHRIPDEEARKIVTEWRSRVLARESVESLVQRLLSESP
ncbi:MAG TPA: hypothetical protein VD971_05335 [Phycisphaerales bacterium]|nr:hypothetical protein [Phycisphaerales bacterium]